MTGVQFDVVEPYDFELSLRVTHSFLPGRTLPKHAKTRSIRELAAKIVKREIDLERLKTMSDDEAREAIMSLKGLGRWSADYILIRDHRLKALASV